MSKQKVYHDGTWKDIHVTTSNTDIAAREKADVAQATANEAKIIADTKALDSNTVHKSGNETISGVKTFTDSPFITQDRPTVSIVYSDVVLNTNLTKETSSEFVARDKNKTWLAAFNNRITLDGTNTGQINVRKFNQSAGVGASLGVTYPATGNPYAFCPTPETNSNTNHIATTEWVRTQAAHSAMPSDRYIDLNLGNLENYIVPSDGFFVVRVYKEGGGFGFSVRNETTSVCVDTCFECTWSPTLYVPCKKNDIVRYSLWNDPVVQNIRFIYAEGAY